MSINCKCPERLEATRAFAATLPDPRSAASLEDALKYLEAPHFGAECDVNLFADFSPHSFYFEIYPKGGSDRWMNGGVIFYAGKESGVGGPQFSVTLSGNTHPRWEIHT